MQDMKVGKFENGIVGYFQEILLDAAEILSSKQMDNENLEKMSTEISSEMLSFLQGLNCESIRSIKDKANIHSENYQVPESGLAQLSKMLTFCSRLFGDISKSMIDIKNLLEIPKQLKISKQLKTQPSKKSKKQEDWLIEKCADFLQLNRDEQQILAEFYILAYDDLEGNNNEFEETNLLSKARTYVGYNSFNFILSLTKYEKGIFSRQFLQPIIAPLPKQLVYDSIQGRLSLIVETPHYNLLSKDFLLFDYNYSKFIKRFPISHLTPSLKIPKQTAPSIKGECRRSPRWSYLEKQRLAQSLILIFPLLLPSSQNSNLRKVFSIIRFYISTSRTGESVLFKFHQELKKTRHNLSEFASEFIALNLASLDKEIIYSRIKLRISTLTIASGKNELLGLFREFENNWNTFLSYFRPSSKNSFLKSQAELKSLKSSPKHQPELSRVQDSPLDPHSNNEQLLKHESSQFDEDITSDQIHFAETHENLEKFSPQNHHPQ